MDSASVCPSRCPPGRRRRSCLLGVCNCMCVHVYMCGCYCGLAFDNLLHRTRQLDKWTKDLCCTYMMMEERVKVVIFKFFGLKRQLEKDKQIYFMLGIGLVEALRADASGRVGEDAPRPALLLTREGLPPRPPLATGKGVSTGENVSQLSPSKVKLSSTTNSTSNSGISRCKYIVQIMKSSGTENSHSTLRLKPELNDISTLPIEELRNKNTTAYTVKTEADFVHNEDNHNHTESSFKSDTSYDMRQSLLKIGANSGGKGVGFFQIGGGIAGDFPICVVPMMYQDLEWHDVPFWSYFCQISDSTTSYGSYSGAVPNEKITWGKLDIHTPKFIVESDATIVAPLIFAWILGL